MEASEIVRILRGLAELDAKGIRKTAKEQPHIPRRITASRSDNPASHQAEGTDALCLISCQRPRDCGQNRCHLVGLIGHRGFTLALDRSELQCGILRQQLARDAPVKKTILCLQIDRRKTSDHHQNQPDRASASSPANHRETNES